jgi:hypothetical protein
VITRIVNKVPAIVGRWAETRRGDLRESARRAVRVCVLSILFVALGLAAAPREAAAQPTCPRVDVTLVEQNASSETRPVKLEDRTIFVRKGAITTTNDISEIKVAGDDEDTLILIKYKPEAAARLLDATTNHDGLRIAFVVDDDVWLAFTWEGPYGIGPEGTQVSIRHGLAKAERLVESIHACVGGKQTPVAASRAGPVNSGVR